MSIIYSFKCYIPIQTWNDYGEQLFASPKAFWLHNGRCWNFAIPVGEVHQQIHQTRQLNENIPLCHHPNGGQCVLDNAHHRLVGLRCDQLPWNHGNFVDFGAGLQRLGQMQIHFIAIKVGIVWGGDGQIHTEC